MKAILLAGGRGSRLSPITDHTPKCLVEIKGETPLHRLVRQLDFCEEIVIVVSYKSEKIKRKLRNNSKVVFITKNQFKENANRYSLYLALSYLKEYKKDVLVFESDMYAEDALIDYISGTDFDRRNTWFSSGRMRPYMKGGYLVTDGKNKITDIGVLNKFKREHRGYYKMMGVLRLNKKYVKKSCNALQSYCYANGFIGYYLDAFNAHLDKNPFYLGNASNYLYKTFNTKEELQDARTCNLQSDSIKRTIEKTPIEDLHPIEQHQEERVKYVDTSDPLKIERRYKLILDGHHRYQKAIREGKKTLLTIPYEYREVEMWSLREELEITKKDVIFNALKGKLYPHKTVKHKFPGGKKE